MMMVISEVPPLLLNPAAQHLPRMLSHGMAMMTTCLLVACVCVPKRLRTALKQLLWRGAPSALLVDQ